MWSAVAVSCLEFEDKLSFRLMVRMLGNKVLEIRADLGWVFRGKGAWVSGSLESQDILAFLWRLLERCLKPVGMVCLLTCRRYKGVWYQDVLGCMAW